MAEARRVLRDRWSTLCSLIQLLREVGFKIRSNTRGFSNSFHSGLIRGRLSFTAEVQSLQGHILNAVVPVMDREIGYGRGLSIHYIR